MSGFAEAVVQIIFELLIDLLIQLGWRSVAEGFRSYRRDRPGLAAVGLLVAGGLSGFLISLVLPYRLVNFEGLRGSSIVVSPLITGAAMEAYGRWRKQRNLERSYFSTFWGGAIFALGMAAVRFSMVGGGE